MSDQAVNALLALGLGTVAAIVLLIPTAAVQYRLDGRLGPRDLMVLVGAAVYGLALWTYTLLPTPPRGDYRCRTPQLDLFGTISLIGLPEQGGVRALLREPALLQVALNVMLFVPLGYFVRVIARRGVAVATAGGLAVSLLIEVTQRTGDWGLYHCAYRRFDVDDLLVNTLGALVGSLLSLLVVRRRTGAAPPLPTSISWGRRMIGMLCDGLFVVMVGAAVALLWRFLMVYVLETRPHVPEQVLLQWLVPFALEAVCVLALGRTVGELVISVRAHARRRGGELSARMVKIAAGIGPVCVLGLAPIPGRHWLLAAYLLVTVAATVRTAEHRGLSHLVAGMDLRITAADDL